LEIINAAFYCGLCDKQYTKITEYEAHLSSYDHNHRKRFKEMKESNRPSTKLDKKREKERKREEKELARMQQAALQRANKQSSSGESPVISGEMTSTSKVTDDVSTKALNGGTNRIDTKSDSLGVGKLEEENYYHATSTAKRKALDSEKIAEETEEERLKRQSKVQKRESIKKELEIINAAFYCGLCDKQYTKITEYEAHLSSYDHNHRKRFKEMKESNRPSTKLDKKREKERKREEKELARIQQAALQRANKQSSGESPVINGEMTSTSKITDDVSTKALNGGTNNGGWATVIEAGTSSVSTALGDDTRAKIANTTSGWVATTVLEKKQPDFPTSKEPESTKSNNGNWVSSITSSLETKGESPETDNKWSLAVGSNSSKSKFVFGISKAKGEQSEVIILTNLGIYDHQPLLTLHLPLRYQVQKMSSKDKRPTKRLRKSSVADRGPNKRKIKLRAIAEQMIEDADPCDSDYQYVHEESSDIDDITDTDDTIVSDKQPEEVDPNAQTGTNNNTQQGFRDDRVKEYLRKWKLDDPGVCCICLEGSTTEENMLVYCDGDDCEVVCHQECYGIVHLPASDEPWYCDRCLAKPSETICALCPRKTGAFRRMKEGDAAGTW
ncbi:238_t:CDS:2, partial [Acaulospora morrowiae]